MPDGRNAEQQKRFEQVEVKPQAIEWAFSVASRKVFNVSADNLKGAEADTVSFNNAVSQQVKEYLKVGFPERAQQFIAALASFYQVPLPLTLDDFFSEKELYEHI